MVKDEYIPIVVIALMEDGRAAPQTFAMPGGGFEHISHVKVVLENTDKSIVHYTCRNGPELIKLVKEGDRWYKVVSKEE